MNTLRRLRRISCHAAGWGYAAVTGAFRLLVLVLASQACVDLAFAQCDAPIDLGRGPVMLHVPSSDDPDTPRPLMVVLHGRCGSTNHAEITFGLTPFAEELGFLHVYPEGTIDSDECLFWNATDACCDGDETGVDDSGYLRELITAIGNQCNVDPHRIYVIGTSNGGFMAYRMACDHADTVAAIVSLAGATFHNPEDCLPSEPVHVLEIHGTSDQVIQYGGGSRLGKTYPGAVQSVETWALNNGCLPIPEVAQERLDLEATIPGEETVVTRYITGCADGGSAELWTVEGGGHGLERASVTEDFTPLLVDYLLSKPVCRGKEKIKKAVCREPGNKLKLKLVGGLRRDHFRAELSTGEIKEGKLKKKGRKTLRFKDLPSGPASATVTWGCGAMVTKSYTCP